MALQVAQLRARVVIVGASLLRFIALRVFGGSSTGGSGILQVIECDEELERRDLGARVPGIALGDGLGEQDVAGGDVGV